MTDDPSQLSPKESAHVLFFMEEMERIVVPVTAREGEAGPITERRRFMESIALLATFLKEMGASKELIYKLSAYYTALQDLGEGTTHPMLEAVALHHGQQLGSEVWRSRATLAICLDYLVRAGLPLADAATRVSKTKGIEKLLSASARNPISSIKNWRVTIDNGSVPNALAKERWKASRESLAEIEEWDAFRRQDWLKRKAEELLTVAENDIKMIPG